MHSLIYHLLRAGGPGGKGGYFPAHILADQLTLFKPGGQIIPLTLLPTPPNSKSYLHLCPWYVMLKNFEKRKYIPFPPPWQTPKTSSKTGSTFGTAHTARNRLGEQSKTPPLLQRRAVGQQPHARLSRLTTKSGSISSKPLLDPNRRSHSATSIQSKGLRQFNIYKMHSNFNLEFQ